MPTETVRNRRTWVIDLGDGRMLAPAESADDVDVSEGHNATLVSAGVVAVLPRKPKRRKSSTKSAGRDDDNPDDPDTTSEE